MRNENAEPRYIRWKRKQINYDSVGWENPMGAHRQCHTHTGAHWMLMENHTALSQCQAPVSNLQSYIKQFSPHSQIT